MNNNQHQLNEGMYPRGHYAPESRQYADDGDEFDYLKSSAEFTDSFEEEFKYSRNNYSKNNYYENVESYPASIFYKIFLTIASVFVVVALYALLAGGWGDFDGESSLIPADNADAEESYNLPIRDAQLEEIEGMTYDEALPLLSELNPADVSLRTAYDETSDADSDAGSSEESESSDVAEESLPEIIDSAHVSRENGENVVLYMKPHPVDVINSLDTEGKNWRELMELFSDAGLEYEQDYVVRTDSGSVYNPENWGLVDVSVYEDSQAEVVITNEGAEALRETAQDASETLVDNISDMVDNLSGN